MELKNVDLETLQQHVDAQQILINLILADIANSNPRMLGRILSKLRSLIDATPQLHPKLRDILETGYMTLHELLAGDSGMH